MIKIINDERPLYKMAEYIQDIIAYTEEYSIDMFLSDKKTQDASIKKIELLGEMVNRLSDKFKESHDEIEWHQIRGLRNIAVHQYDSVSMDDIWDIIISDIPVLNNVICNILENEYDYDMREFRLNNDKSIHRNHSL